MVSTFYDLDESARALVARVEGVVREAVAPRADLHDREARFPRAAIEALARAGLFGLTVPASHGGLGAGPRTFAAVVETIASGCASTAMVYVMHVCATNVIAGRPPRNAGDVLAAIAAGRHLSTLAFSEKGSRSHFWAPVSREAARAGGRRAIDAEKSWVTSAGEADSYVVSTLAAAGDGPLASSLYLVPKGRAGLEIAGRFDGMGLRANASAPMRLYGVEVDDGDLLSEPGRGFDVMMSIVLPWFQVGTAAMSIGVAEAALGATSGHLTTARFEHLGETLAHLPNLRANVARMRMEIDRSRAYLAYTVGAMERPGDHTMPAVLSAKAQAAEMAVEVTDLAMRTCGGAAFSRQLPVERHFRDARASSVMAPTTDQLRDFLGRAALGLPLF